MDIQAVIDSLTPAGLDTMKAVANGRVSFFDDGLVEGSGIWGEIFTEDMGHNSSGVINRLAALGLFVHFPYDKSDPGDWWELTALGAAVAVSLKENK